MWKYDISANIWEYVCGNRTIFMEASYGANPYPGGLIAHMMVLDNTNQYLYLFGGTEDIDGVGINLCIKYS